MSRTFCQYISGSTYLLQNSRATDHQELVNGSQIVGEETSNRWATVTNLFTDSQTFLAISVQQKIDARCFFN
jgi:hypothetical protein